MWFNMTYDFVGSLSIDSLRPLEAADEGITNKTKKI